MYIALLPASPTMFLVLPNAFKVDSNELLFEAALVIAAVLNSILVWVVSYVHFHEQARVSKTKSQGTQR